MVLHCRGLQNRVGLVMVSMWVPIAWRTARSAMEKGWRSSENSDVEEPRLRSVQYSSPSHDFAAPPSPVQGRLVETHTHTHKQTHAHTQSALATTPSGSYRRRLRPRCDVLQALVPRKACEMRQADSGARPGFGRRTVTGPAGTREAVAIPASTRCFDFQVWAVGRRS